jgi:hypothetical protein
MMMMVVEKKIAYMDFKMVEKERGGHRSSRSCVFVEEDGKEAR